MRNLDDGHPFLMAMFVLEYELRSINMFHENAPNYALFGSASLFIRGIIDRDPGDVDVMVTRRTWGILLAHPGWWVHTPNAGDPPILVREASMPIHLFFDWRDQYVAVDIKRELTIAEPVKWEGSTWRCTPIAEVKRHKQEALRYYANEKRLMHEEDIAAIEEALSGAER